MVALFYVLSFVTAPAQTNLSHLKSWIGKYPTDQEAKPVRKFFNVPEIQGQLKRLLTKKDFSHLTQELEVQSPIELVRRFLVIKVCRAHWCPADNAMLVINLEDGVCYVGFYQNYENKSVTRWFSSKEEYTELPDEILDDFLHMHKPK